jgi:hypothetical protein
VSDTKDQVMISKQEYKELLIKADKYDCLVAYGVDNWSGYSDAMAESMQEE